MNSSPVIQMLRERAVVFSVHEFQYQEGGGTKRSSSLLGVREHAVVKSLVFESDGRAPLLVLMHGDQSVDTVRLAEQLGVSKIWSCAPKVAEDFSGWPVGATNPFILKTAMPIYLQSTILEEPKIYINGGGRGLLVGLNPADLMSIVRPRLVRCAKEKPVVVSKAP